MGHALISFGRFDGCYRAFVSLDKRSYACEISSYIDGTIA